MSLDQTISDYPAARGYLRSLKTRGVHLGLERMRGFLEALGNPHAAVPCIHIAGTNGKGSVAAMLEAIMRQAGWRTGLYTSPHLVRLGERVQVNRRILSEGEITAYVQEMQPVAARQEASAGPAAHPSYFEFMTALACLHFARQRCDVAIIEVGLGGRLDATNVVTPDVSVITSIGLDHCEILGPTLAAIAAEKAGIIKSGRPVVMGCLPDEAERVIRGVAASAGARVVSVVEMFGRDPAAYPTTNLEGPYQHANAAAAAVAARWMAPGWRLTETVIARGLMSVDWPGRWQRKSVAGRTVIIDSSHNAEGAAALAVNLARLVAETGKAPIVVVGVLGATRARAVIAAAGQYARQLRLVVPAQGRACSFEELEGVIPATFRGMVERTTVAELFPGPERCTAGDPGDVVVVTGSIYLAGEVLVRIDPAGGSGDGDLQDF